MMLQRRKYPSRTMMQQRLYNREHNRQYNRAIGNSIGNSIGNTIGNSIGNSIGNTIGNSIKKNPDFPDTPFTIKSIFFIIVFKKGLMPY